jgi:hypothetical protein
MVNDFMIIKRNCPFCAEIELGILLHNANSDPHQWVDLIDDDLGDQRRIIISRLFESKNIPMPTGIINNTLVNFTRGRDHTYWFLRNLKEVKTGEI